MTTICSKCGSEIETTQMAGGWVNCPICQDWVKPTATRHQESSAPDVEAADIAEQRQAFRSAEAERNLDHRRSAIRATAHRIGVLAAILLIGGFLAAIASLFASFDGNSTWVGWLIASTAIGSAFWLYLIEQVIHIRANTEK